jgi:AAA family ATP:ADP antiporter
MVESEQMTNAASKRPSIMDRVLQHTIAVNRPELRALAWAFSYFFALLCSYYIIRPMRDEMGIAGGVKQLQWMFSGTFLAMLAVVPLFGWLTRRFAVRRFLPYVYYFFIANLLLFFVLFKSQLTHAYVARAFFIWASVFNLFVVSVFWSFMADTFTNEQAKRLFGVIAAGGTAGALAGPALTAVLVVHLGPANLLPVSAAFLTWTIVCIHRLIAWRQSETGRGAGAASSRYGTATADNAEKVMGGSILAGISMVLRSSYLAGICLLMLLFTTLATFLYFQQAQIIRERFDDPAARTALFAAMDFSVNAITLVTQIFLTGRIIRKMKMGWTLALVPLLLAFGFLSLGLAPVLGVLVVVQVLRRAGNYAVMRPAREMLYVVVDREQKYKAKNFIDTVVYRGGDAVSAWAYAGLQAVGLAASQIALAAVPLAGVWAWTAYRLGKRQEQMAEPQAAADPSSDAMRRPQL